MSDQKRSEDIEGAEAKPEAGQIGGGSTRLEGAEAKAKAGQIGGDSIIRVSQAAETPTAGTAPIPHNQTAYAGIGMEALAQGEMQGGSVADGTASGALTASGNMRTTSDSKSGAAGTASVSAPLNSNTASADLSVSPGPGIAVAMGASVAIATATAAATVTRFSFPPEWEASRQEAIRLLTALRQTLRDAEQAIRALDEPRRHGVGGNHPPESIGDMPLAEEIITEATVAQDALLTELRADSPHISSVRIAAIALRRVANWTGAILRWLAEKGDRFLDDYLKQLAKPAAYLTVAVILEKLLGMEALLHSIIERMSALFVLLHIPF